MRKAKKAVLRYSAMKQLLEASSFTTDVVWMNTKRAVSLANHLRAVADAFRPLRTLQRY